MACKLDLRQGMSLAAYVQVSGIFSSRLICHFRAKGNRQLPCRATAAAGVWSLATSHGPILASCESCDELEYVHTHISNFIMGSWDIGTALLSFFFHAYN